ncbi:hypothetical protein GA0061098_102949 [Bradyrhizobium shewense]|uniref:Uncharacterized protein n=1 Tax=Bradyrhizobium shewense TaxID=1761772 RepID=A0A1C3XRM4_9BRAD|nr:hypothetical protein [Bradyrhizobium shewense]SCB54696.1 hypothetical protein GA0061098_102949 [Bradyrhizobium shewense]
MGAINIICGHREVIVVSDTAFCDSDGAIARIASRVLPSNMCDGMILAHDLMGLDFTTGNEFVDFDDAIEHLEAELAASDAHRDRSRSFVVTGWSQERVESEAYAISTAPAIVSSWHPETREFQLHRLEPYKLLRLPQIFLSPAPDPLLLEVASIGSFHLGWRPDKLLNELGKVITTQRHSRYNGQHVVGGFTESNSVDVDCGSICSLVRPTFIWDYDEVGRPINPKATDWTLEQEHWPAGNEGS